MLPKLYGMADVFISATRGEGFGIPIAEAMASGNLVIVPNKGGHMDFCNTANALLLDSVEQDIPGDLLEEDRKVYSGQKWVNSSIDNIVEMMRHVRQNYDNMQFIKDIAKKTIAEYCNYKKIITLMENTL
jgi:glycosyltransferase involved in cell wall biosynthesis